MRRHRATRRRAFGQRLHEVAEIARGHAPKQHRPAFTPITLTDDREIGMFLRAFGEREAARIRAEIERAE